MIEALILIFKVVGLVCVTLLLIGITVCFLIWIIRSVINDIRHDGRW